MFRAKSGQMQVAAAVLLLLATTTTVVAINSTSNLTSVAELLPVKLNEFFFKTVEVWAGTSIDFEVAEQLLIWLRMDDGSAVANETLHVNYSGTNFTENLTLLTGLEGDASLELEPGNYSFNVSFPGGDYLLPSKKGFEVEIFPEPVEEPANESEEAAEEPVDIQPEETADGPVLELNLAYPEKITRGDSFNISVELFNSGGSAATGVLFEKRAGHG